MTSPIEAGAGQMRFDGRVAVVTGAGRGIGRAHAMLLAARGARVVVNDLGTTMAGRGYDEAPAATVAAEIAAGGGTAVASTHDISTDEDASALVDSALERFGRIDIVINNAGIIDNKPFADVTRDDLERMLSVHVLGSWGVTHAAWPHLIEQGYGRVLMTTSSAGLFGMRNHAHYCAAKTAVIGLVRALALEGEREGVKVNGLAPGAYTRMLGADEGAAGPTDATRGLSARMSPDAIAPVAAMLAHESCPLSGEIITAVGGHFDRVFLGETRGVNLEASALSPEVIHARLNDILAEDDFDVPRVADTAWMEGLFTRGR